MKKEKDDQDKKDEDEGRKIFEIYYCNKILFTKLFICNSHHTYYAFSSVPALANALSPKLVSEILGDFFYCKADSAGHFEFEGTP